MAAVDQEALAVEKAETSETLDYKMVTFSLGGRDYGIDIMDVKEIAKFSQFTYVPNTAPYVRGVYNLRGDIISVVDLRLMFNLPAQQRKEGEAENGLILRHDNGLIGVIVDSIDRVVAIPSNKIQPPHPIFGDINVKFIDGVVEHEERLYIILSVARIVSKEDEEPTTEAVQPGVGTPPPLQRRQPGKDSGEIDESTSRYEGPRDSDEVQSQFIAEGLATFKDFHVTSVNRDWFEARVLEWSNERKKAKKNVQLQDDSDAEEFLSTFYSPYVRTLWGSDYFQELASLLPDPENGLINVWNPGAGEGYEAYSITCILKSRYSRKQVKVWASDNDLLEVSNAPNLVFPESIVPDEWKKYTVSGKHGWTFASEIRDAILFEFSDVLNTTGLPKMDIIVARDELSFHKEADQRRILDMFDENMKPGGVLILGTHEQPADTSAWDEINGENLTLYRKR